MTSYGVALDLGTSGFRGQAIDLNREGHILSTAITTRHPLPGANVIDHIHFALEVGPDAAHQIIVDAANQVIAHLKIDTTQIMRLAVCGNPIQLSLFQGIEIRDLPADTQVLIPPAVRHEIGADALAMMIQTNMLELDRIAVVTDYGTNNEMALLVDGVVYTGSTAAGPALEGQHIEDGLLALPGAIADMAFESREDNRIATGFKSVTQTDQPMEGSLQSYVLDPDMHARPGDTVDPQNGDLVKNGELRAVGITGTGVVALICQGIRSRLIRIPNINTPDGVVHLPDGIKFTEKDLREAGKAIGAVRAGHITLCQEAGISLEDIEIAFSSGASGTYVDALKAQQIGMIPPSVKQIYQVGNTSLAMARDMVNDDDALWRMKRIADDLRQHHCMFAESKVFEKVYILELSFWTEGMPLDHYQKFLKKYGFPQLPEVTATPEVIKTVQRDIQDLGELGLDIIEDIGQRRHMLLEGCLGDAACVAACPENALAMEDVGEKGCRVTINLALCDGVACRRCERACKEKQFNFIQLVTAKGNPIIA